MISASLMPPGLSVARAAISRSLTAALTSRKVDNVNLSWAFMAIFMPSVMSVLKLIFVFAIHFLLIEAGLY